MNRDLDKKVAEALEWKISRNNLGWVWKDQNGTEFSSKNIGQLFLNIQLTSKTPGHCLR